MQLDVENKIPFLSVELSGTVGTSVGKKFDNRIVHDMIMHSLIATGPSRVLK